MSKDVKIAYIGELDRTPNAPDHLGIRQGLEYYNYIIVDPILNSSSAVIKTLAHFKPDIIIHGNTDSLNQKLASQLVGLGKQVFWMLDYQPSKEHYHFWNDWIMEKNMYDAIFISNKDQISMWSEAFDCPAYYLTHGCVVQDLVVDEDHNYDLVFIGSHNNGNWYNDRYELIEKIKRDNKLTIINEHDVEGRNIIWSQMPAIYHSSKCVLDISHSWKAEGYASGRFFYTAGLGGCSITKRFPGCEDLYPKECKAYFDTPQEAKELIDFYQNNKKEREEMKRNAWMWNRDNHHYKLKFEEIISKL